MSEAGTIPVGVAPDLSEYYYRDNFVALCDSVMAHYGDVLLPPELNLLDQFGAMDHRAQCLYVRLISRVGPLFRTAKLDYPEIGALKFPLSVLHECGLVKAVATLSAAELGSLFTKAELASAFGRSLDLPPAARKEIVVDGIEALHLEPAENFSRISSATSESIVCVLGGELVQLLQLLFFGNRHQSLTDFILSDLGITRYYPYSLDRKYRLFSSRAAVDEHTDCGKYSDAYFDYLEAGDREGIATLAEQMLDKTLAFDSSARRWERTCIRVARELERGGDLNLALRLYGRSRIHPARERSARILESRQDWASVISACDDIRDDPRCEAELEAANRICARAVRKSGGPPVRRARDNFEELHLVVRASSGSVELDVAAHMERHWNRVHFVENALMNTLFGLAFWEQIFSPVPGAFHNPYQSLPADMFEGEFLRRRAEAIGARVRELRTVDLRVELNRCRQKFAAYQCRWTHWQQVDAELQDQALSIIPAEHLLAIWERQLFDPKENRNGFPDLIALGGQPGEYCMIEVKGPGDRLQDNQKRWLRYFSRHDIPAMVAWVEWEDA